MLVWLDANWVVCSSWVPGYLICILHLVSWLLNLNMLSLSHIESIYLIFFFFLYFLFGHLKSTFLMWVKMKWVTFVVLAHSHVTIETDIVQHCQYNFFLNLNFLTWNSDFRGRVWWRSRRELRNSCFQSKMQYTIKNPAQLANASFPSEDTEMNQTGSFQDGFARFARLNYKTSILLMD